MKSRIETIRRRLEREATELFYVITEDKNGTRKAKRDKHAAKVKQRKAYRHKAFPDSIVKGVTVEPPGSGRVADLAAFYAIAEQFDVPPSPFSV